jgi:hypothetical protein
MKQRFPEVMVLHSLAQFVTDQTDMIADFQL